MYEFTDLELAALRAIFLETPEFAPALELQLASAIVTKRENSGHGFFTNVSVAAVLPITDCPSVLGQTTHARIRGLEHGFGFVLFLRGGRLHMLEGYATSPENTHHLDLTALQFDIYN